jgi:inner membrane protein
LDSLSQIALGSAIAVATMGRRTAVWKAVLWGAVAGTLPDLDVLIDYGDAVRNMVMHRGHSHSLFWLTLFSLPFGVVVAKIVGQSHLWQRWCVAMCLALITHPLLDTMTVYGTQLAMPFSNYPYAVGSVFIIDLLYTIPLLVGVGWALKTRGAGLGLRANAVGLWLSTAYLAWGVFAQQHIEGVATGSLAAQGIPAEHVLVTPTAFNSLLWRVVVVTDDVYYEGTRSLFDSSATMAFEPHPRGEGLAREFKDNPSVQRIRAFSHGFYAMHESSGRVFIRDLRMGQEPNYTFTFAIADRQNTAAQKPPEQQAFKVNLGCGLKWIWQRIWNEQTPTAVRVCGASS